MIYHQLYKWLF